MSRSESLAAARRLAQTLIYEGYVLYPYRASAQKNQVRWQWGVLAPPSPAARLSEVSRSQAQILVEPRADTELSVELRFLQLQQRSLLDAAGTPVGTLAVGDIEYTNWDEGVEVERTLTVAVSALVGEGQVVAIDEPGGEESEPLHDAEGRPAGTVIRRHWPLAGRLTVRADVQPGPYEVLRLSVVVENLSDWDDPDAGRAVALRRGLLGAHAVLALSSGQFLSLLDPPEWAKPAVAECSNQGVWPVLVGEVGHEVVLVSPIILYDHPTLAPESPGDLYDALEIDEILSLRTMSLTEQEKREARATDPRAAAIIDRVDAMPAAMIDKLHGGVRYLGGPPAAAPDEALPWWDPGLDSSVNPDTDSVQIEGVDVRAGSRVVLMPGRHRRSDAQDAFLVGRTATVQAVLFDVDEGTHLAVTVDDDPGADLQQAHGRFLYFQPDEVEPAHV